jgi:hypothetical protein
MSGTTVVYLVLDLWCAVMLGAVLSRYLPRD